MRPPPIVHLENGHSMRVQPVRVDVWSALWTPFGSSPARGTVFDLRPHARQKELGGTPRESGPLQHPQLTILGGCSGLLGLNLHAEAHAAIRIMATPLVKIGVEASFDSGYPSTARQQQMEFRSDLVLTLFADLLALSL